MGDVAKLNLCLDMLGGMKLETFTDRKVLQKRIYLLQEFGVDLGYPFGWYIHGPYSSELTSDAFLLFQQRTQAPNTIEKRELSSEDLNAMEKLKAFLKNENMIKNLAESGDRLELLSSLHFLWKFSYFEERKTKETITEKLKEQKRGVFRDEDITEAWKLLETSGLVSFGV